MQWLLLAVESMLSTLGLPPPALLNNSLRLSVEVAFTSGAFPLRATARDWEEGTGVWMLLLPASTAAKACRKEDPCMKHSGRAEHTSCSMLVRRDWVK